MNGTNHGHRLLSLDILRGITVAGMILVNHSYGDTFAPLQHSAWNGMTPCDLVLPFFLYIMGISTYLSLRKYQFQWSRQVACKILRRTVLIFLIGLCINWLSNISYGDWQWSHLRIMAVLQRIALCYGLVSLLALSVNHKYLLHVCVGLLIAYTVILFLGNGYAEDATNLASRLDTMILGTDHLYHHTPIDPEGLLGTLPAVAHTLIGFLCGRAMMKETKTEARVLRFLLYGGILVIGGYLLSFGLPLNKCIWSPSYVLVTCGLASLLQGILMYNIDIRGHKRWTLFFLVFGINPLFLYVLSEVMSIFLDAVGASDVIYQSIHAVVTDNCWASLCFALTHVLICGVVGWVLYRRKVFIKI